MKRLARILVLGGTGFIGRYLVQKLGEQAALVAVPTRAPERAKHLLVVPNCEIVRADVHDDAALARLVRDVDAVVNLVGVLHDARGTPYGPGFARAHVELPRRIARACVEAGVRRVLHVSALGVTDASLRDGAPALPSMYLRSKADGERALREASGLAWTVFRPSVVFGREDRFLNLFARLSRLLPVLAVGRADARFAPVYVGDVAQAIASAVTSHEAIGRAYELVGPEVYTLRELVRFAGRASGHERTVIGLPDALGRLQAAAFEFAPGPTLMSRDNFDSMSVPSVAQDAAAVFPPELGVPRPEAMSVLAPTWLAPRSHLAELRARH